MQPTYQTISPFKYPGARPLYIYVKNAHARAIPAIRAFVAEFTKESAMGPNGYLKQLGLVAAPERRPRQVAAGRAEPDAAQLRRAQIVELNVTQECAPPPGGAQSASQQAAGWGERE